MAETYIQQQCPACNRLAAFLVLTLTKVRGYVCTNCASTMAVVLK